MATTAHERPKIDSSTVGSSTVGSSKIKQGRQPDSGGGGWQNLVPADGAPGAIEDYSPPPASTGIWVIVYSITMTFAALTSAMIVRRGSSLDWQSFKLPSILFADTALIVASSVTLEIARRRVAKLMGGITTPGVSPARWLYITVALGLFFVMGQYTAWVQLREEGLYLSTNPSSSFFYLLTVAHALHVLGGLIGLGYVIRRLDKSQLRRSTLDAASHYWHFVDLLWVYLLLLLWMKL